VTPFAALGRAAVRFRWVVLVVWLVGVPVAVTSLPTLSSVAKNDNTAFLPASAPSQAAATLASPFQPKNNGSALFVAVRGDGPLTAADTAAITRAESALRGVYRVRSVQDQGPSADGHAQKALVELNLAPFSSGPKGTAATDAMRGAVGAVARPAGLAFHMTGAIPTVVDQQRAANRSRGATQQAAVIFIVVLLLLVFRALLAPIVTLFPAALALALAGPVIAESTHIGVQVSDLLQLLLVVIVLGAGTDYGLFLIFRMREELRGGRDPKDAVVVAVTRVGESITFSALTVVAALVSLLLASFGLYKGLGPGLAIGVALCLVADLTLLPALLAILGRAVFWPSRPRPGQESGGFWGSVAGRVVRHPVPTLASGLVLFGGLAVAMVAYHPGGFGAPTVSATSDSSAGTAALTSHYAAAEANPTTVVLRFASPVWDDTSVLGTVQQGLRSSPLFRSVAGPLDPNGGPGGFTPAELRALHALLGPPGQLAPQPSADELAAAGVPLQAYEAYRAEAVFVSADGRTVQYFTSLAAGDPAGNAAINATPAVRAVVDTVARRAGAARWGVTGEAPSLHDVASVSSGDLAKIIPVLLVVLAVLLAVVLRSLVAPLYLVVSVGLSYLASLGFSVLVFSVIGGEGGINFVLPFFMFIFIMALGEDYNILVMSRIREEAHDHHLRAAVRRAVQRTGTTVTSAGLILAGTFAVLTVAGGKQVEEIGVGLAVGVLLDTFFVRTLLVPSMVVLIGRANWWPSKLYAEEKGIDRDDEETGPIPLSAS
jgi:RND superfamily putative drug exporter